MAPFVTDWTGKYTGSACAVVLPGSTNEVAAVLKVCAEYGCPVVPQGGHTSLSGGATPDASGRAVVLSLRRMAGSLSVDPLGMTARVSAGVTLQQVHEAAEENGLLFPLAMSSQGSAMIGGVIATNAGGISVLRYGPMRSLVLGLEVALPDGRIWEGTTALRKDNTGLDLRDLFIGSEGTLGVITGAVLRLVPRPTSRYTAVVALADIGAALTLLQRMRQHCGDRLSAFEYLERPALDLIARFVPDVRLPFADLPPALVLLECTDTMDAGQLRDLCDVALGEAIESGLAEDALIAANEAQREAFWLMRESISQALVRVGKTAKHDISLPIDRLAEFVTRAGDRVALTVPGAQSIVFGHLGDGNLHYNVIGPNFTADEAFYARHAVLAGAVHDLVLGHGGSISAEHGVGQLRAAELARLKPPLDLALMRQIKAVFDPDGRMNPGKLFV